MNTSVRFNMKLIFIFYDFVFVGERAEIKCVNTTIFSMPHTWENQMYFVL